MKFIVLVAPVLAGFAAITECVVPRPASFLYSGSCIEVRESAAPASSSGQTRVATEEAAVGSGTLDFVERGPSPWQKDRATHDRERALVLDRELGAPFER